jgi:hypothetical protein
VDFYGDATDRRWFMVLFYSKVLALKGRRNRTIPIEYNLSEKDNYLPDERA